MRLFIHLAFLVISLVACNQQKTAQEYIDKGLEYYAAKDWKSSIIELKNAVKVSAENAQARAALGKAYLEVNDFNAAIKELKRAQKLGYDTNQILVPLGKAYKSIGEQQKILNEILITDKQSAGIQAVIHAIRATAYLALNDKQSAYDELKQARSLDENATEVRLAWGQLEQSRGNTGAQMDWIKPLFELDGGVADAWSQLGDIELRAKRLDKADEAFTRAIQIRGSISSDVARRAIVRIEKEDYSAAQSDLDMLKAAGFDGLIVHHAEGVIAFKNKKYDEAKTKFKEVLSKSSNYSPSQYLLARIYFNERDFNNAEILIRQYLENHPQQLQGKYIHAVTLLQLSKPDQALKLLNEIQKKLPQDIRLYSLKAKAFLQLDDIEQAVAALQQGLRTDPKNSELRYQYGSLLLNLPGRVNDGQQQLLKVIESSPASLKAEMALYISYIKQKNFSKARQIADSLAKKKDTKVKGQNLIGLTYLAEGKKELAVKEFEKILSNHEADFLTSHNLAKVYLEENRLDEAKKLYSSVVEKNPGHTASLTQLAIISARQGQIDETLAWLNQSVEQNPDQLSPKLTLAIQYIKNNDAERAVQLLNGVTAKQKETQGYLLVMAQAKISIKESQHAIRLLKKLNASNDEIAAAHFLLATAYYMENKSSNMRQEIDRTLQLSPDHLFANLFKTRLNLIEGDLKAFSNRLSKLEKLYPDNDDVKFLLAKQAALDHKYPRAISILTELSKNVQHRNITMELAKNYWQSGDKDNSISELKGWLRNHPDDTPVEMLLAQFYINNKSNDKAMALYQKIIEKQPENVVILNNLAWLYLEKNPAKGMEYAASALKLMPDNALIEDTMASLALKNGDRDKALEFSAAAAAKLPDNVDVQLNYSRALVANGSQEKARRILQKLLKKSKDIDQKRLISKELDSIK